MSCPSELRFFQEGVDARESSTLKGSLKSFNLNPDTWELAAQNRNEWRAALHNGAKTHEKERTITAEKRRQARKSNADRCSSPATIPCPKCTRTFRAPFKVINIIALKWGHCALALSSLGGIVDQQQNFKGILGSVHACQGLTLFYDVRVLGHFLSSSKTVV